MVEMNPHSLGGKEASKSITNKVSVELLKVFFISYYLRTHLHN